MKEACMCFEVKIELYLYLNSFIAPFSFFYCCPSPLLLHLSLSYLNSLVQTVISFATFNLILVYKLMTWSLMICMDTYCM